MSACASGKAASAKSARTQLWTFESIETYRVSVRPDLRRIIVAVDPLAPKAAPTPATTSASSSSASASMARLCLGRLLRESTTISVGSRRHQLLRSPCMPIASSPKQISAAPWSSKWSKPPRQTPSCASPFKEVKASRGKVVRAEPVAALYEQGKVHHVGSIRSARGRDVRLHHPRLHGRRITGPCRRADLGAERDLPRVAVSSGHRTRQHSMGAEAAYVLRGPGRGSRNITHATPSSRRPNTTPQREADQLPLRYSFPTTPRRPIVPRGSSRDAHDGAGRHCCFCWR